jgi:hypothetical protein
MSGHPSPYEMLTFAGDGVLSIDLHREASKAIQHQVIGSNVNGMIPRDAYVYKEVSANCWLCEFTYLGEKYGGIEMESFLFPIDQRGTHAYDENSNLKVPGYCSKRAAKNAALFHAMCVAEDKECKFASVIGNMNHVCLRIMGSDFENIWAILYKFQGELYICPPRSVITSRFKLEIGSKCAQHSYP